MKRVAESEDVDKLADTVQLRRRLYPEKQAKGVFISMALEPDMSSAVTHWRLNTGGISIFRKAWLPQRTGKAKLPGRWQNHFADDVLINVGYKPIVKQ